MLNIVLAVLIALAQVAGNVPVAGNSGVFGTTPPSGGGGAYLWAGIIDPSRAIDWSLAGATIATGRAQCVTSACATVSGGSVTAATVNAALASAPSNTYVLMPAGTFSISASLVVQAPGNVTLRGSGPNSTFLSFTGSSAGYSYCSNHDLCAASSDTNNAAGESNSASWTGGYSKGASSITINSVSGSAPAVGQPIILDQIDNQTDNGGLYVGCELPDGSAACYSGAFPTSFERGSGSLTTVRGQQQIVQVTSVSGSGAGPYTVGITPSIYAPNWNSVRSPGAWWASHPVYSVGFEDFSFTPETGSSGGIFLFNCQGCWVKGVRGVLASSPGATGWGDVVFSLCNHCTVRDSYFYGHASVDDYVLAVDSASDLLVENNIFQFPGTSQFYNSDCEGCVADYNYSAGTLYSGSTNWLAQPSDYHGIALFSLAEGNIGAGLYADSFHGTHDLNTNFRNRWDGREQNNGIATSINTVALILNPGTRYHNAIGNILGTPGYHTNYETVNATNYNVSVIDAGYYPSGGNSDSLTRSTSMFWGNWDSATGATSWNSSEVPSGLSSYANPVPASHTLPASFIYSSRPSWWPSGKAWPPIGPDVTGGNVGQCSGGTYSSSEANSSLQCSGGSMTPVASGKVVSIPAMDCYLTTMGGVVNGTGAALAFDHTACGY